MAWEFWPEGLQRLDDAVVDKPVCSLPWFGRYSIYMTVFSYSAREAGGRRVEGRLEAASRQAAVSDLQGKGLSPIHVREAVVIRVRSGKVPERKLATAYIQLADLLRAGVPILRALELLGRGKSDARLASAVSQVAEKVADGSRMAEAMQSIPETFPPIHTAMVRAGERGGFLEDVLAKLGTFLEQQSERRSAILGSLIYPVIMIVIGLGIVIAAMVFFVPRFQDYFDGIDLPLSTQLLMGASDVLIGWWGALLAGLGVLIAGWFVIKSRPTYQRKMAGIRLKLPLFGALSRSLAVARFTRILGTLLENGIPLMAAMSISRDSAGNILLIEAIDEATEAVGAGESLSQPLARSGLFGEDVVEMISVGESANTLPDVLKGVADGAERRTDRILNTMMKLLEPVLLLFLAGAVLFIFLALVVPMMQLGSEIS